ncbi:MAG: hypothetical protein DCC71_12350 [Proteobacteria bacterium]|nr:MAG: hypothetical protein DCC71_12350 [Pseudomonadota bacterium]
MAEDKAAAGATPQAGGGKKKLFAIAAAMLVLAGGGGAFLVLSRGEAPAAEGAERAGADGAAGAEHDAAGGEGAGGTGGQAPLSERLLSLDPFVVNLDDGEHDRFLKTRIELETKSPVRKAKLVTQTAQMRDAIIVLLTSKRVEDLGGFEGKVVLKNEIERRLNDVLGEDEIQSVLITEFVIQ